MNRSSFVCSQLNGSKYWYLKPIVLFAHSWMIPSIENDEIFLFNVDKGP